MIKKEMKEISFMISNALSFLSVSKHEEFIDGIRKFIFNFIGGNV